MTFQENINMPADLLATPVHDVEFQGKTLKDLIKESIDEYIFAYTLDVGLEGIKSLIIVTRENNYKFVPGAYCDVIVKQ